MSKQFRHPMAGGVPVFLMMIGALSVAAAQSQDNKAGDQSAKESLPFALLAEQPWHGSSEGDHAVEGRPASAVDVLRDRQGDLWIATAADVLHFDGEQLQSANLKGVAPRALAIDGVGTVWLGADTAYRLSSDGSSFVKSATGLGKSAVTTFLLDLAGNLYAGTETLGIYKLENQVWTKDDWMDLPASGAVTDLAEDSEGGLWVTVMGGGAFRLSPKGSYQLAASLNQPMLTSDETTAVVVDEVGRVWIGSAEGVDLWSAGKTQFIGKKQGLSGKRVNALQVARDGSILAATDGGIDRFTFDQGSLRVRSHVLKFAVGGLAEDASGLWLASKTKGLIHLSPKLMNLNEEALRVPVLALIEGANSELWIGSTEKTLLHVQADQSVRRVAVEDLRGDRIQALAKDYDGAIWVGTDKELARYAKGVWAHYDSKECLDEAPIRDIAIDSRGRVWAVTKEKLTVVSFGRCRLFGADSATVASSLAAASEGGVWAGYGDGTLSRLDVESSKPVSSIDTKWKSPILSLTEDQEGNLWVLGNEGLGRVSEGKWTDLTGWSGLDDSFFRSLAIDTKGQIWLAQENGLRFISASGLATETAPGSSAAPSFSLAQAFGSAAGDPRAKVAGARTSSPLLLAKSDGSILIGSDQGLVQVPLGNESTNDLKTAKKILASAATRPDR